MGGKGRQVAFGAVVAAALIGGAYNGSQGDIRIGSARQAATGFIRMPIVLYGASVRLVNQADAGRDAAMHQLGEAFAALAAQPKQH
jgi:hypothetical protein